MSYIIRAYFNDNIKSADLSKFENVSIGSDTTDTIFVEATGLAKSQIKISKSAGGYVIKGKHLYDSESSRISSDILEEGNRYLIDCKPKIILSVHPKQDDSKTMLGIDNIKELTIGRSKTSDILLINRNTSRKHCVIQKSNGVYRIKDLDSRNGTFVNGKKILRDKILNDGDIINISVYQIIFQNRALMFYNVGDDMDISDTLKEISSGESKAELSLENESTYGAGKRSGTVSMYGTENKAGIELNFGMGKKSGTISMYNTGIVSQTNSAHSMNDQLEINSTYGKSEDTEEKSTSEAEREENSSSGKKGTISMFDMNININIDENK